MYLLLVDAFSVSDVSLRGYLFRFFFLANMRRIVEEYKLNVFRALGIIIHSETSTEPGFFLPLNGLLMYL